MMAIDYSGFAIPKGTPRILDRIEQKRRLEKAERDCRRAVRIRDHGQCVVPACRQAATHMHHIVYRSKGGTWQTSNICSLCVLHHGLVHGAVLQIRGNADTGLQFRGRTA